jgi:hypothetical protein
MKTAAKPKTLNPTKLFGRLCQKASESYNLGKKRPIRLNSINQKFSSKLTRHYFLNIIIVSF